MRKTAVRAGAIATCLTFSISAAAFAHVKWFTAYSYAIRPQTLPEVLSPLFWGLLVMSIVGIGLLVVLDQRMTTLDAYERLSGVLARYAGNSDLIVRVAVGAVLLFCWQAGKLLVPDLPVANVWIELAQLGLACMVLANRGLWVAGWGIIGLYGIAFAQLGSLHILDYSYILGAGFYVLASGAKKRRIKDLRLPVLYGSVGFSLCWAALEKLVYPEWALSIFTRHPFLTMGLEPEFFLRASAFVEFVFGFLLLVCLMQRVMALVITGLFISTTLVFGKEEFVGHAIVHAALIVFILKGAGTRFRTPITFFYHMKQRLVFSAVSFILVLFVLLVSYCNFSMSRYESVQAEIAASGMPANVEATTLPAIPKVALTVLPDSLGGWNVNIQTTHFTFAPHHSGRQHVAGEGHAHLFIDNEKVARIYGNWFHIPQLEPGKHEVTVTLNTNNHAAYVHEGVPISAWQTFVVEG